MTGAMQSDTKQDPYVTGSREVNRRKVELALSNCMRAGDVCGRLFMPDTLRIEWMNGRLMGCDLSGRLLRADGARYLDERRGHVSFTMPGFAEINEDTPEWVLRLIKEYQP